MFITDRKGARRRPLFRAGWTDVLMVHYEVDPDVLQRCVSRPVDLFEGRAYVSLVLFTLDGLRFHAGGPPFTTHRFLNVRAYVQHGGIEFIAEWLTNPLAVLIGPRLYGLPYRWGRIRHAPGHARGRVSGRGGALEYRARATGPLAPCVPGTLDHFLMERYVAYTRGALFRVWHEPWRRAAADVEILDDALLGTSGRWFARARRAGAHLSPGLEDVWIGAPEARP